MKKMLDNVVGITKEADMAINLPYGDNHRIGAVCSRSQTLNPKTNLFTKRNAETGRFMDVKQNGTPFKGVRKEK
jgi:hypothetical protein